MSSLESNIEKLNSRQLSKRTITASRGRKKIRINGIITDYNKIDDSALLSIDSDQWDIINKEGDIKTINKCVFIICKKDISDCISTHVRVTIEIFAYHYKSDNGCISKVISGKKLHMREIIKL